MEIIMSVPMFDPKELEVRETIKDLFGQETRIYSYPVNMKEAVQALLRKEPYWLMTGMYPSMFGPRINPDNIARAQAFEAQTLDPSEFGGQDMFGIEWEYIPEAWGSMVRPGHPLATDANDLLKKITWPDPDTWDWEASAEANANFLKEENCNVMYFLNGWYERLISMMDFENAIFAVFDEDQKDAVHAFFDRLTDLYINIFDKCLHYFPMIDGFNIHDDWGSQKETFFSPDLAEEMIVPYMRRLTDFIHSKGRFCELHSCGNNARQVPNYIRAGWDIWQGQAMNDTHTLYEKYGDQIILGVLPEPFDPNGPEELQRKAARNFVDHFMLPGKPCILNYNDRSFWTIPFMEELYVYSRKKACGMV